MKRWRAKVRRRWSQNPVGWLCNLALALLFGAGIIALLWRM